MISSFLLYDYISSGSSLLGEITRDQVGLLLTGSICDAMALISMCIAFQSEQTSVVSMVGYLAIVYALFTDLFIFGETLGNVELLGCAFVISITLIMGFYRMHQNKKKQQE